MADGSVAEVIERFSDPLWRLSNLYWIIDKHGRRVPFELNTAQANLVQDIGTRDVILKARQLGMTTLMSLVSLDEAFFNPNWNAAVIAHKLDDAKKIFDSKIRYPYDNLADGLKASNPPTKDAADALSFANNSSVSVTTSARSGTLQRLHVSEFGKICAQYPQKAREIITGSFPAAEHGCITIESTAEGQEGAFYELTQRAQRGDGWRFHFFPWFDDPGNVANPATFKASREDRLYFDKLRYEHGIELSLEQEAWWVKSERDLGGDMKRENPATPEEAFEQAIEGAYFATQLAHADKHGLIGRFPYDPRFPVNTFWDLGRNDLLTIWFHQRIGERNRFVGYYENSGEHISHYARHLRDWERETGCQWGTHYWPHDGDREDLFLENGRLAEAEKHGLRPKIVKRAKSKMDAIDAARAVFPSCDFDEAACAKGVKRLRHYRKEWDEQRGVWKDRPRHDENSHGADGFMTFACGYESPRFDEPDDTWDNEFGGGGRSEAVGY
ncbi:MAG: hypothetical protein GOVbin1573_56 [Prokaryotic dsDNA virus sp.]|nr:MAG: hypothetical protein GOVbin1573_56 [Prokaryotic dsDNA virus sp.]